jgi:hypothetical protein
MSSTGVKRKSRFEDRNDSEQPDIKKPAVGITPAGGIDVTAAAARAAELSKELASKVF